MEVSLHSLLPQSYNDYGGGNHFDDMLVEGTIIYQPESRRQVDRGEMGASVLAMNYYFRWPFGGSPDWRDVDNVTWILEMAGRNFDPKGGTVYPFVLVADVVNGRQVPSSGRYWQYAKPLTLGTFDAPYENAFSIPSSDGWFCTYSRAGAISNAPRAPDLRYIECIGFGVRDFGALPTGDLGFRSWTIG